MESVQEAVDDRRKNNADNADQSDAAEERITAGEDFPRIRLQRGDRTHARKNHRRVQEGVNPRQLFKNMIADHAEAERYYDDDRAKAHVAHDAPVIFFAGQQRLGVVLEHAAKNLIFWEAARCR